MTVSHSLMFENDFGFLIQLEPPKLYEILHKGDFSGKRNKPSLIFIEHMSHHLGKFHDCRSSIAVAEISHGINVIQRIEQEMRTELKLQKLQFRSQLAVSEFYGISLCRNHICKKPDHRSNEIKPKSRNCPDKIRVGHRHMGHPQKAHPQKNNDYHQSDRR